MLTLHLIRSTQRVAMPRQSSLTERCLNEYSQPGFVLERGNRNREEKPAGEAARSTCKRATCLMSTN